MATAQATPTLNSINITDEARYNSEGYPWADWDLLRREAPVYWYTHCAPEIAPFWAVTRHEDIQIISRHPEVFISSKRLRLHPSAVDKAMAEVREAAEAEVGHALAAPLSFIDMDPPHHAKYRALTNRRFTPRAMRALEAHFEALGTKHIGNFARRLVDGVAKQGACDLVHDFAIKVPTEAIFDLLGIPEEGREQLFEWRDSHYLRPPDQRATEVIRRRQETDPADQYLIGVVRMRRDEGATGDDLISVLIRSEADGEPLSERAILSYVNLLVAGGLDTTRHATTAGVIALLEHPEELHRLVENPGLLWTAIEEMLRWTSPVIHFTRTCVADFELRGQLIRAGEDVAMWYPSANRDEEVFEDPYRFDITREPNNHLAFGGFGEHFCLGANLARWELYSVFSELLRILPDLEMAGEPRRATAGLHVGGYQTLPVRLKAGARIPASALG
jgi:cholest-4-en-3-one 26-monooxygenase